MVVYSRSLPSVAMKHRHPFAMSTGGYWWLLTAAAGAGILGGPFDDASGPPSPVGMLRKRWSPATVSWCGDRSRMLVFVGE